MDDKERIEFVVGPQATDSSFLGRRKELEQLQMLVFSGHAVLSLVGPTRIGKSSLVSRALKLNPAPEKQIRVKLCMGEMQSRFDFWTTLFRKLCRAVRHTDLWNEFLQEDLDKIEALEPDDTSWFQRYRSTLEDLFAEVENADWSVLLIIDEFDGAQRVFGEDVASYHLLRSIYSDPIYCTHGILISRKPLSMLEKNTSYLSSFHGIFNEFPLRPFSDDSMEEIWRALKQHDIALTPEAKEAFLYYADRQPYLCSMFCSCMTARLGLTGTLDQNSIRTVFESCLPEINKHYDSLASELQNDGFLEFAQALSLGIRPPRIGNHSWDAIRSTGELVQPEDDVPYFFTRDFMEYLREQPLNTPIWDSITGCEQKLKDIFRRVYPALATIRYRELCARTDQDSYLKQQFPQMDLEWETIKNNGKGLVSRKPDASILDTLTLTFVTKRICKQWNTAFARFFPDDAAEWRNDLQQLGKLRNAIAHGHIEYIETAELARLQELCRSVIALELPAE